MKISLWLRREGLFESKLRLFRPELVRFLILGVLVILAACPWPTRGQAVPNAARSEQQDMPPGYPSLRAPWTSGNDRQMAQAQPQPQPPPVTPPAPVTPPQPATAAPEVAAPAPETAAPAPGVRRNEVSVSGDYFLGQGNVTMPFGFSLGQTLGSAQNIVPTVAKPDRTSDYFGGTISYSHGQKWYLDLAYAHGDSSGTVDVALGGPGQQLLPSAFSIKDDWYQAYIRYVFSSRGKFGAYLRAGVSYVQAELTDDTTIPALGLYHQTDKTDDLLGNLGFGLAYSLYASRHTRLAAVVEGEGFYGHRTQKSLETLPEDLGLNFATATIDNDLYGVIGRGTVRFEYRFGQSSALRAFVDGGVQARFTFINYPNGLGTFDELLWGPYVKAGVRFSF